MARTISSPLHLLVVVLALVSASMLSGCAGVSAGANSQVVASPGAGPGTGTLAVSPSSLNFGNVAVGGSSSLTASLSASKADVTVSSAAWNGSGYSVSGITFPVTITAGQSAPYTVTFSPPASGTSPGNISFRSNASDASLQQSLSGSGAQGSSGHTVALSWNSSTSSVVGYNLYRGIQSGGPYSLVNPLLLPSTSYTDASVQSGTTYYYVSTAVDASNGESAYSNEATASVP
jgi:hypothetical protein